LPEIPPDTPESDVLLKTQDLVNFNSVTPAGCYNAIAKLSLNNESGIWKVEKEVKGSTQLRHSLASLLINFNNLIADKDYNVEFEDVIHPLEELSAPLEAVWGVAKTLHFTSSKVMPQKSYHTIHEKARKAKMLKFNSKPIYQACKVHINRNSSNNSVLHNDLLYRTF
jgi:oligopeptidase A